jgi:glyoxylase I family protein
MPESRESTPAAITQQTVRASFHGVRYQVADVTRSIAFYTEHLGFTLEHQQPPAFANVSLGPLRILLSGPGASGSRPMPDGRRQEPGGWNRVVLRVENLSSCIEVLKQAGVHFRNQMEVGPGSPWHKSRTGQVIARPRRNRSCPLVHRWDFQNQDGSRQGPTRT